MEYQNLCALTARRRALIALSQGLPDAARAALLSSWRHACAAMYWAISTRDYESCQNLAVNMGLIQSTLADAGDPDAIVYAFRFFRLGIYCSDEFRCGNDSTWEYICVGNLWLDHRERRVDFENHLTMGRHAPDDKSSCAHALARAKDIGEPRQIALCAINLWRFGREIADAARSARTQRTARDALRAILQGREELNRTLHSDGAHTMALILNKAKA